MASKAIDLNPTGTRQQEHVVTNFNEAGKGYVSYALRLGNPGYGVLGENAANYLEAVRQGVAEEIRRAPGNPLYQSLFKLLNRLNTVLYYSGKVAAYLSEIYALPQNAPRLPNGSPAPDMTPPMHMLRNHVELGMEFETLVLHSVAALDTLSNVCAEHCVNCRLTNSAGKPIQPYFSNLKEALQQSQHSDIRSEHLFSMMCEVGPLLSDIVLSVGRKTLRNHLAHESNIPDLTESNFVIHWLENGRVLRLDHEVYGIPLIASARNLTWSVSYLLLRSVGILLARTAQGALLSDYHWAWDVGRPFFEPAWENRLISWRSYLSDKPDAIALTVARTNESGFRLENVNLSPAILELAESV
jgi:hypothetical protein